MSRQIGPVQRLVSYVSVICETHIQTYSKVKCQLGPLMFYMRKVARLLMGFEAICKCGRVDASQEAEEREDCSHRWLYD
jgi:hypothetical protein